MMRRGNDNDERIDKLVAAIDRLTEAVLKLMPKEPIYPNTDIRYFGEIPF